MRSSRRRCHAGTSARRRREEAPRPLVTSDGSRRDEQCDGRTRRTRTSRTMVRVGPGGGRAIGRGRVRRPRPASSSRSSSSALQSSRSSGFAKKIALAHVAVQLQQPLQLVGSLDALGDRLQVQDAGQLDHGGGQRRRLAAFGDPVDERLVDLEDVDGEAPDVVERRVAGAEVVDREHARRAASAGRAVRSTSSMSCIITLSVISRIKRGGSRPVSARMSRTSSTISGRAS